MNWAYAVRLAVALAAPSLASDWLASRTGAAEAGSGETQYRFDSWRTEQGLPQNTVKCFHQTPDGYLWFGTRFGLVRFDGVTFRIFDSGNTPALKQASDNLLGLVEDREGHLWISTIRGLIELNNQEFIYHALGNGTGLDRLWTQCPSRAGGIWVGKEDGLFRFVGGAVQPVATGNPITKAVQALHEDPDGTLWIGQLNGLRRRDPESGAVQTVPLPPAVGDVSVRSLFRDRLSALWVGTTNGLCRLQDGAWTTYRQRDGLAENWVASVSDDRDGNCWIVTGSLVLHRLRDNRIVRFGAAQGLTDDSVQCVTEDREGNLWVGTTFGGLNRMQPRRIDTYSERDGLGNDNVWTILQSRDGAMWLGTDGGLSRWQDGRFTTYRLPAGRPGNQVRSLHEARDGTLWVGTMKTGLMRFAEGQFVDEPAIPHARLEGNSGQDNLVNAILEDRAGDLWVGARLGLYRRHRGQWNCYTAPHELTYDDVRCLHEDHTGTLWIGTYGGGLNRWRDGQFSDLTTRDGLSNNFAWAIHEDADGVLWIGTEIGLNRYQDGQLFAFGTQHGLFNELVNHILEDAGGNLWISCNRGIYRVRKAELHAVAAGRLAQVQSVPYGMSDGMLSSETNGENSPAGWRATDGRLWFPTTQGAVAIVPEKLSGKEQPPSVIIESVEMNHQPVPVSRPPLVARVAPGGGEVIEFQYTATSLVAPEKIRFKYCLDGCDKDWVNAGSRRVAYYTNLRPGAYRFRVLACNNHGLWNEVGASFSFVLEPYFYQTKLFYGLCAGAGLLAGYGVHRLRVQVLQKIERLEKQTALERERARIAHGMHDDFGGSLTQIALLTELAQRDLPESPRAQSHLQKIHATSRELFRGMDEMVWAVNPRHDTLASLIAYLSKYAQDFLRTAGLRCRLDLPVDLPGDVLSSEARHHLFLAAKEALTNIVRHAAAAEVWIRVHPEGHRCRILIEDNGCGFDSTTARPDGNGLGSLHRRLVAAGGRCEIESRPGGGTRVIFEIPGR